MNYQEMAASVSRDEEIIERAVVNLAKDFSSRCLKTRKFPFSMLREYRSSHGECNDYLFLFLAKRRGDWDSPQVIVMCQYRTPEGMGVICKTQTARISSADKGFRPCYDFISPHFVKRYAERRMGDLMLPEKDVLRQFFLEEEEVFLQTADTKGFVSPTGRNADKEDMHVVPLADGAAIVQKKSSRISVYTTYIAIGQLKEQQMEFLKNHTTPLVPADGIARQEKKQNRYRIEVSFEGERLHRTDFDSENDLLALQYLTYLAKEYCLETSGLKAEAAGDDLAIIKELEDGFAGDGRSWKAKDGTVFTLSKAE